MASKRSLSEDTILRYLLEDEAISALEDSSDSEQEDIVEFDDAESDTVDEPYDEEDILQNDAIESQPLLSQAQESSNSPYILTFSRSNIRSRSRHVWATNKGSTSKRTAAINIVHVARGPGRSVKNICDSLALFDNFMTDEILEEIIKWTNAEITIKKQNYEQNKYTQSETNKAEIKALLGIFVLSAALRDSHLSLKELFNIEYFGTRYNHA